MSGRASILAKMKRAGEGRSAREVLLRSSIECCIPNGHNNTGICSTSSPFPRSRSSNGICICGDTWRERE